MLDVSLDSSKYVSCLNCNEKQDEYRKIYSITIGNLNPLKINLCTECMGVLVSKMTDVFNMEFSNNENTDYDIKIASKLRILLNKKISGTWNENCQRELESLDEKRMCNSYKLLYRDICNW